jgi:hypothetical protein
VWDIWFRVWEEGEKNGELCWEEVVGGFGEGSLNDRYEKAERIWRDEECVVYAFSGECVVYAFPRLLYCVTTTSTLLPLRECGYRILYGDVGCNCCSDQPEGGHY